MCAINPAHKKRFIIDVYTSIRMEEQDFEDRTLAILLTKELELNSVFPKFRWHLKESEQQAD